jgi:hypothetical protein
MFGLTNAERPVTELIQPLSGSIDAHCYKSYTINAIL